MSNGSPMQVEIEEFCKSHDCTFYRMGTPDDWNDKTKFRASSHTFPAYGINIAISAVFEWVKNPPYIGEGI